MKRLFAFCLCVLLATGCAAPNAADSARPSPSPAPASAPLPAPSPVAMDVPVDFVKPAYSHGEFTPPLLYEKEYPPRPEAPNELAVTDPDKYYDAECYGWNAPARQNVSCCAGGGAENKRLLLIFPEDNEFYAAFVNGAARCAEHYGASLSAWCSDADGIVQNELINRAVQLFPDAVLFVPTANSSAEGCFRRLNEAGIPVFCAGTPPESDVLRYVVSWVGRDEWDQARTLARAVAERLNKNGGAAYFTLDKSDPAFNARFYGVLTELSGCAPDVAALYAQVAANPTQAQSRVAELLADFGGELDAIILSDDSAQAETVARALESAGRTDVVVASAGTSEKTAALVESGTIDIASAFSGFDYGAAIAERAALWFEGEPTPQVSYFTQGILFAR